MANNNKKTKDIIQYPLYLGADRYVMVSSTKETAEYLDIKTINFKDSDLEKKTNIFFSNPKKKGTVSDARGSNQKTQRIDTRSSQQVAQKRIILPSKRKIRTDAKYFQKLYLVFPRGINLILISEMLNKAINKNKIRPLKGEYCFRLVGGGWHPIADFSTEVINTILSEKKIADQKSLNRNNETSTEELQGE